MKTFTIRECGDPYSKAWDVIEETEHGSVFRGDISGLYRKARLKQWLARLYPGCKIKVQR